jgi:tetratricopeptide (TPR) repeat protein
MKEAQSIWEFLVEFFEKNGNLTQLQDALYSLAWILQSVGARKNATQMMKRMEELAMNFQNERNQAIAIDGQAVLLHQRGISNTGKALELSEKAEALCRKIGDNQLLCVVLGNQALFYLSDGESDKAMTLLDSCEKLARGLNDNDTLMACLDNKSVIMTKEGKFDEALNLLKAQEQLCRKFNNTTLLQSSIGKQAFILTTLRKPEEAQLLWYEQERLCMGLDRIEDLLKCLIDQARNMSYNLDNPREALNICDKALRILYAEERKPEVKMQMLYMSVNIKGVRYEIQNYLLSELMEEASEQMNTGEYKKAYSLYEEAINLSQQLGEKESEQICFVNMLKLNDKK